MAMLPENPRSPYPITWKEQVHGKKPAPTPTIPRAYPSAPVNALLRSPIMEIKTIAFRSTVTPV